MLNKEQFEKTVLDNMDEMYASYSKSEKPQKKRAGDALFEEDKNLPEFHASDAVVSEKEKMKMIEDLEKSIGYEKMAFNVGKSVIKILIKSAM